MPRDPDPTASIAEQAAQWWVVFHSDDTSAADHREFAEWVARSPERVEAYLRTARVQQALKSSQLKWPDTSAEVLIREAKASPDEPVRLPLPDVVPLQAQRRSGAGFGMRSAFALAATVLVGVGLAWFALMQPQRFQAKIGEQRSVLLEDGSRITLNTASRIEVRLRKDRRLVHLIEGEALFDVAHDPARVFDVQAGNASLRAVGTRFDVDLRSDRTTVTVVEGLVAVLSSPPAHGEEGPPTLAAADRIVITRSGAEETQHGVNVAAALSWTQRQLWFDRRPLGEVAEEFNRYNRQQIRIDGAELRLQKITGVFQSNDVASFVSFLSGIPGARVRDDGAGGYVVTIDGPQPFAL